MIRWLAILCAPLLPIAAGAAPSAVRFQDVPQSLREFLPAVNDADGFDRMIADLNWRTAERLRAGQRDALMYYVLQASGFTQEPAVEPALAARAYFEEGAIPATATARFAGFARACLATQNDRRLRYFCDLNRAGDLANDFPRAMRFLYQKEFEARKLEGDNRRDFVASLYRNRGLSTDSSFDANVPVFLALKRLAGQHGLRFDRVLILGPGLEFAPRTKLNDSEPQSIQPFAVADALLQLGLSTRDRLRIHCLDLNPLVVEYFQTQGPRRLTILARNGPPEYEEYFQEFGRSIGRTGGAAGTKTVDVPVGLAGSITAQRLNILTERDDALRGYDLAIATNVLVYMDAAEMALAFANVASMLRNGGYFVHNELRAGIEGVGRAASLPVVDARMVRLFEDDRRAIFDGQVTHRKDATP